MKTSVHLFIAAGLLFLIGVTERNANASWQQNLAWCFADSGAADCPQDYLSTLPECLTAGNRSCLMRKARDAARTGNCDWAMRLSLICQCHNGAAASEIAAAGQDNVCDWLKNR